MGNMGKAFRLQSAMEYLMTYGWAILIIAVVLGALFSLGIFNPAFLAPKVQPGSCQVERPDGPGTSAYVSIQGNCNNELPEYVAQFNGQSSYIIPSSNVAPANGLTISMWEKWSGGFSIDSDWETLYAWGPKSGCDPSRQYLVVNAISKTFQFGAGCSEPNDLVSTTNVIANTWEFVTLTLSSSGQEAMIYIDGVSASPYTNTRNGQSVSTGNDNIGNSYVGGNLLWPFYGSIADVQVYNTSLSSNEILFLYREGIGGEPINLPYLVGWWPLNGNANDYSGNENSGVNSNVIYTNGWTSGYIAP